jgi:DNA-directed RNA polymerase
MPPQRNSLLNKSGRLAWLNSLSDDAVRGLAQQWSLIRWKEMDVNMLKLQLAQIEGVECPLNVRQ